MELPEIRQLISSHLSPHDKVQCILVSKTWYQWFLPSLWKRVAIHATKLATPKEHGFHSPNTTPSIFSFHDFVTLHGRQALLQHGHLISELTIDCFAALKWIAKSTLSPRGCINLNSLIIITPGCPFEHVHAHCPKGQVIAVPDNVDDETVDAAIANNIIIDTYTHNWASSARIAFAKDLAEVLMRNQQLRKLDLKRMSNSMNGTDMQELGKALEDPQCCPKLEFVAISFKQPGGISSVLDSCAGRTVDWDLRVSGEFEPLTKDCGATTLIFENVQQASKAKAVEFLKHLPNLKKLSLESFMSMDDARVWREVLVQSCPKLESINLCFDDSVEDESFAMLLESNNSDTHGWKSITLSAEAVTGSLTVAAVLKHVSTLEEVEIEGFEGLDSPSLQVILAKAPKLRRFWTLQEGETVVPIEPKLTAGDIVGDRSAWDCEGTLETLGIVISEIPRPDITKLQDGNSFEPSPTLAGVSLVESRALQRKVCRKLGSLTKLKKLALGHDDRDWGNEMNFDEDTQGRSIYLDENWQYECLAMSLDTGLDLLSGLKELEELDVTRMSHKIGAAEVAWMSTNWPKLKSVCGLHYDREKETAAAKWLRKNRPDIHVESSMSNFVEGVSTDDDDDDDDDDEDKEDSDEEKDGDNENDDEIEGAEECEGGVNVEGEED